MGMYAQLLAALQGQNGGAQGFMQPGGGAPQISPYHGNVAGASQGAPMMSGAMPQGATQTPQGAGGMFASLQNNPMLMMALQKQMLQGAQQPGGGQTPPAAYGQGTAPMNGNVPLPSQQGAYNTPQQSWLQQLMMHLGQSGGNS